LEKSRKEEQSPAPETSAKIVGLWCADEKRKKNWKGTITPGVGLGLGDEKKGLKKKCTRGDLVGCPGTFTERGDGPSRSGEATGRKRELAGYLRAEAR